MTISTVNNSEGTIDRRDKNHYDVFPDVVVMVTKHKDSAELPSMRLQLFKKHLCQLNVL